MNLFVRDMELLTGSILELAALAEERIHAAIRSLCDRKPDVARQVVRGMRSSTGWRSASSRIVSGCWSCTTRWPATSVA